MKLKKVQQRQENKILISSKKIAKRNQKTNYKSILEIPCYKLDLNKEPFDLFSELFVKHKNIGAVKLECDWDLPNFFKLINKTISVSRQCVQGLSEGQNFKLIPGLYTIKQFKDMADKFEKSQPEGNIENQYWDLVNNKQECKTKTFVDYGSDLASTSFGSGFPELDIQSQKFFNHKYNLFNINQQQNSLFQVLRNKEEQISGVTNSWMYLGMKYASFCWHTENMFLPSLNYHHEGAGKTWYFIPEQYKEKFDSYFFQKFKNMPNSKEILKRIIVQIDPIELISQGIQLYKCVQTPKSFILTFPKVYHCGFSHGYNMTEAINVLWPEVMPYLEESLKTETKEPIFPLELFFIQPLLQMDQVKFKLNSWLKIKICARQKLKQEIELRKKLNLQNQLISRDAKEYYQIQCWKCKVIPYFTYIICTKCNSIACLICLKACGIHTQFQVKYRYSNNQLANLLKITE